jgi:DNA-binding MurR/RpiR family transcriptional regulator
MANGNITVEVLLPRETMEAVLSIAKTAGVSPASVIKVAMALQVLKFPQEQAAPPESA